MKKISIIIPVYNMADKIVMCVNSILKQTYNNIEICLIDDGSTDESYEQCKKLAEQNPIIKVWHTKNMGSGPARNYGVDVATGYYAYFPDADDLLEANALEVLVNAMNKNNCDLVVFGYRSIDRNGKIKDEKKYSNNILLGSNIRKNYENYFMNCEYGIQGAPWNKFFNLHKIKKNNIKYPSLRRHQDEVFISRYINYVEKVCFIENIFYSYFNNDLKREWDKYPKDYLDIVIALKQYRIQIIIPWNPENQNVINFIEGEYICNVIKSLELSFSNKMNFDRTDRQKWIVDALNKSKLKYITLPEKFVMKYQRIVMFYISKENYNILYWILFIKVFIQKNFYDIFNFIKKTN
jgi:glycosyltransferase involved in cell wall biosynthesis